MTSPCVTCGAPTIAIYRLCPDCHATRMVNERAAQGLPSKIEDPVACERIATILRGARRAS